MSSFDTSGEVALGPSVHVPGFSHRNSIRWADLDAFTQGYIEAVAASAGEIAPRWNAMDERTELKPMAFSDLSSEALARIIADCRLYRRLYQLVPHTEQRGRMLWEYRSKPGHPDFPPLTPTLRDDGKVYLAEVQS